MESPGGLQAGTHWPDVTRGAQSQPPVQRHDTDRRL